MWEQGMENRKRRPVHRGKGFIDSRGAAEATPLLGEIYGRVVILDLGQGLVQNRRRGG